MDWMVAILGSLIGGLLLIIIVPLLKKGVRRLVSNMIDSTRKWLGITDLDKKIGKLGNKVDYIRREEKKLKDRINALEQAAQKPGATDCNTTEEENRGEGL